MTRYLRCVRHTALHARLFRMASAMGVMGVTINGWRQHYQRAIAAAAAGAWSDSNTRILRSRARGVRPEVTEDQFTRGFTRRTTQLTSSRVDLLSYNSVGTHFHWLGIPYNPAVLILTNKVIPHFFHWLSYTVSLSGTYFYWLSCMIYLSGTFLH